MIVDRLMPFIHDVLFNKKYEITNDVDKFIKGSMDLLKRKWNEFKQFIIEKFKITEDTKRLLIRFGDITFVVTMTPFAAMVLIHIYKMAPLFAYFTTAYIAFRILFKIARYTLDRATVMMNL